MLMSLIQLIDVIQGVDRKLAAGAQNIAGKANEYFGITNYR